LILHRLIMVDGQDRGQDQARCFGIDVCEIGHGIDNSVVEIEDQIRAKEAKGSFDQPFIELARSVYINNDKRARLKREINELLKSELVEEKQYTPYAT